MSASSLFGSMVSALDSLLGIDGIAGGTIQAAEGQPTLDIVGIFGGDLLVLFGSGASISSLISPCWVSPIMRV